MKKTEKTSTALTLSKETLKKLEVRTAIKTGVGDTTYPGYSYTCHPSPCGSIIPVRPTRP